jgi:hypothetical protein
MRVDTRPRFEAKEKIVAKGYEGYENELTIPYKGKVLEKTFEKGSIVLGELKNIGGQDVFLFSEYEAKNTIDKDTKKPYTGKAHFMLDPTKGKITKYGERNEQSAPTKEVVSNDKENVFWESLGFSTSGMIKAKVKGRFYLVVALVAGYFVYKKFKK